MYMNSSRIVVQRKEERGNPTPAIFSPRSKRQSLADSLSYPKTDISAYIQLKDRRTRGKREPYPCNLQLKVQATELCGQSFLPQNRYKCIYTAQGSSYKRKEGTIPLQSPAQSPSDRALWTVLLTLKTDISAYVQFKDRRTT